MIVVVALDLERRQDEPLALGGMVRPAANNAGVEDVSGRQRRTKHGWHHDVSRRA